MQHLFHHRRLPALAAIFVLSGCSISSAVSPSTPAVNVRTTTSSNALLYVANGSSASGVDILTFPQGKRIAKIANIGGPQGVCADALGHVWVTTFFGSGRRFALYEFARGATTPLHTVKENKYFGQCTVDPQGNVAVLVSQDGAYGGAIEVWRPSLRGKPLVTRIDMDPVSGAYDADGNLFVHGYQGSDPAFGMLPAGGKKITFLRVKGGNDFPNGCVGWDGTYVTLGSFADRTVPVLRLAIKDAIAKVASVVHLHEAALNPQYALLGTTIVATQRGSNSTHSIAVGVYDYPAGGKPTAVFSGFDNPRQIAISPP